MRTSLRLGTSVPAKLLLLLLLHTNTAKVTIFVIRDFFHNVNAAQDLRLSIQSVFCFNTLLCTNNRIAVGDRGFLKGRADFGYPQNSFFLTSWCIFACFTLDALRRTSELIGLRPDFTKQMRVLVPIHTLSGPDNMSKSCNLKLTCVELASFCFTRRLLQSKISALFIFKISPKYLTMSATWFV